MINMIITADKRKQNRQECLCKILLQLSMEEKAVFKNKKQIILYECGNVYRKIIGMHVLRWSAMSYYIRESCLRKTPLLQNACQMKED